MKTVTPVSPYLRRPLRSLQEVLQTRRRRGGSAKTNYGLDIDEAREAENNNVPPAILDNKSA